MSTTVRLHKVFSQMQESLTNQEYNRFVNLKSESEELLSDLEKEMIDRGEETDSVDTMRKWADGLLAYMPEEYHTNGNGSEPIQVENTDAHARTIDDQKTRETREMQAAGVRTIVELQEAIDLARELKSELDNDVRNRLEELQVEISQAMRDELQNEAKLERESMSELLKTVESTIRSLKTASDQARFDTEQIAEEQIALTKERLTLTSQEKEDAFTQKLEDMGSRLHTELISEQNIVETAQVNLKLLQAQLSEHGQEITEMLNSSAQQAVADLGLVGEQKREDLEADLAQAHKQMASEKEHLVSLSESLRTEVQDDLTRFRTVSEDIARLLGEIEAARRGAEAVQEAFRARLESEATQLVDQIMATSEQTARERVSQIETEGESFRTQLDTFSQDLVRLQEEMAQVRAAELVRFDQDLQKTVGDKKEEAKLQLDELMTHLAVRVQELEGSHTENLRLMQSEMQGLDQQMQDHAKDLDGGLDRSAQKWLGEFAQMRDATQARLSELVQNATERETQYSSMVARSHELMDASQLKLDDAQTIQQDADRLQAEIRSEQSQLQKVHQEMLAAQVEISNMHQFLETWAPDLAKLPAQAQLVQAQLASELSTWQTRISTENESFVEIVNHVETVLAEAISMHRKTQDIADYVAKDVAQRAERLDAELVRAKSDMDTMRTEVSSLHDKSQEDLAGLLESAKVQSDHELEQTKATLEATATQAQDVILNAQSAAQASIDAVASQTQETLSMAAQEAQDALHSSATQAQEALDASSTQAQAAIDAASLHTQEAMEAASRSIHDRGEQMLAETAQAVDTVEVARAQVEADAFKSRSEMTNLAKDLQERWNLSDQELTELADKMERSIKAQTQKTNKGMKESLAQFESQLQQSQSTLEQSSVEAQAMLQEAREMLWESAHQTQTSRENFEAHTALFASMQQLAETWQTDNARVSDEHSQLVQQSQGAADQAQSVKDEIATLKDTVQTEAKAVADHVQNMQELAIAFETREAQLAQTDAVIQELAQKTQDDVNQIASYSEIADIAQEDAQAFALRAEAARDSVQDHLDQAREEHAQAFVAADEASGHLERIQALLSTEVENHPVMQRASELLERSEKMNKHINRYLLVAGLIGVLVGAAIVVLLGIFSGV